MTATAWLDTATLDELQKEAAAAGAYLNPSKLTDKERRVRFVGQGITGWTSWTTDDKPVRWEEKPAELPDNLKPDLGGKISVKRFLATLVYDYESEEFKIFEITQKSLMEQLFKYIKDSDYGDPTEYDIKLSKTGSGKETSYSLVAAPPKLIAKDITARFNELTCNLNALFDGEDPFADPKA
jgi:hypothetical protein